MKTKKTFVLDTNVILHDFNSIYNFEENDIVLPIVVLEELDHFKKGNETINFHARQFMRELDKISEGKSFKNGISLGEGKGNLFINIKQQFSEEFEDSFTEKIPDHKILSVANNLLKKNNESKVILISQDINLRMKAKALGIETQDYETGKVANIETLHKKIQKFDDFDMNLINKLYQESTIDIKDCKFDKNPQANDYFILRNGKSTVLAHYNKKEKTINKVEKKRTYGIKARNSEQTFALDALMDSNIKLVTITGKAGTGKTLLALAAALQQRKKFQQILLARPIVPLANRDMGFLPGSATDKITPYMQPLFDNLTVIKHSVGFNSKDSTNIDAMLKEEKLLITPLAYIRGRSLSNIFFIVDEAQNLTPHEIKTIITRAGENTKMIFTGDIYQIDSPYLDMKSNGLSYLTDKLKGHDIFAHVKLVSGERSQLAELASNLL